MLEELHSYLNNVKEILPEWARGKTYLVGGAMLCPILKTKPKVLDILIEIPPTTEAVGFRYAEEIAGAVVSAGGTATVYEAYTTLRGTTHFDQAWYACIKARIPSVPYPIDLLLAREDIYTTVSNFDTPINMFYTDGCVSNLYNISLRSSIRQCFTVLGRVADDRLILLYSKWKRVVQALEEVAHESPYHRLGG